LTNTQRVPAADKKKTVSALLDEEILSTSIPLIESYNSEKDPKKRPKIQYALAGKVSRIAVRKLANLSDRDWKRFLKEQIKPFAESIQQTDQEILKQKLKHGELGLQDLDLIYAEKELLNRFRPFSKGDNKLLTNRRTIERFMILNFIQYIGLANAQRALNLELEPFQQLNAIVHRRFGAQYYWSVAVALLATHENLVKKKLVELGMQEENIQKLSKSEGFPKMIEQLATLIERKEKRNVSLTFYRTSSLRTVRNKLEHEGYKLAVTRDEVIGLLKDTLRFETELFPSLQPANTGK